MSGTYASKTDVMAGRCETCKHWGFVSGGTRGICNLIKSKSDYEIHPEPQSAYMFVEDPDLTVAPSFETASDFGCVRWENRDDSK